MKKPTTMNSKPNTLTGRCDLLKSPPPLTNVNIITNSTYKATIPALLHSVYTRVGRAFSCLVRRENFFYHQDRIAMRLAARFGLTCEYKLARRHRLTPIEPQRIGI